MNHAMYFAAFCRSAVAWNPLSLLVQVVEGPNDVMLSSHIFHLLRLSTLCRESDPLRPPCSHKDISNPLKGTRTLSWLMCADTVLSLSFSMLGFSAAPLLFNVSSISFIMVVMYSGLYSFGLFNSTIVSLYLSLWIWCIQGYLRLVYSTQQLVQDILSHSNADMFYKNNSIMNFKVACCSQLNACSCSSRGTFLRGYREPDKYNLLDKYAREGLDQSAYISGS